MNKAQDLVGAGNLVKIHPKAIEKLYDYGIPERMHGGLIRYVEQGIPPGDFLQAVINNDLREACGRADDENKRLLPEYIMWFYNWAPGACWGSPENFKEWMEESNVYT
jgi:hypothetical protein